MGVDQRHRLGHVLDAHAGEDRSEDFLLVDGHVGGDMVEQRAADPEPLAASFAGQSALEAAAVDQKPGPLGDALGDTAFDAGPGRAGDDRAHLGLRVGAVQHLQGPGARLEFGDHLVGDVADQHGDRDGHAAFAGRAIGRPDQGVDHLADIGVGHHHQVILGAAQGLHPLAEPRAGLIDVIGDRGRTDEGDRLYVGMLEQRVDRLLVALHDIEHAVGQAGLLQQPGHQQARAGIERARLEDEGVAGGDRDGEHPHRHHHREIERGDAGHHAERLACRPIVDAGRDLLGEIALQQLRNAAGEFDHFQTAGQLAARIRQHLAMLGGDQARHLVGMPLQQFLEFEQDARPAQRRRVGPGRESGVGGGHGGIDLGAIRQRHPPGHGSGRGIEDVARPAAAAGADGAGDEMADLADRGGGDLIHAGSPETYRSIY